MKTIKLSLSASQDLFLRSTIRREILRKYVTLVDYSALNLDITVLNDDIFELKTLYRQLTGKPFRF